MEPTYTITPPELAPQEVRDRLGEGSKTLAQLQEFVTGLAPQINFQKKMQSADIETLTEFLEANGYEVDED